MRTLKRVIMIIIALAFIPHVHATFAQDQAKEKPWIVTYADKTKINSEDLNKILADHKKWFETYGSEGAKAVLEDAYLGDANLKGAYLGDANLKGAYLDDANLKGASLDLANLEGASLWRAILKDASLNLANLEGARLGDANLEGASLLRANLKGANLGRANLKGAILLGANLKGANLLRANLKGANLDLANLEGADLGRANLEGANLVGANLEGALITEANLTDCLFDNVEKFPLNYEPKAGSTPYIPAIADAPWLKDLTYDKKIHGLVDLREGFKKLGYREQERKITYAIKHTQNLKLLGRSKKDQDENEKLNASISNLIGGYINLVLFEWTCEWGMSPIQPFLILICLIPFFSIFYIVSLILPNQKDGIWSYNQKLCLGK